MGTSQSIQPYSVNLQDIRSHSSFLTNERLGQLFMELDFVSKNVNESYSTAWIKRNKAVLFQIWKTIRSAVENSPYCRVTYKLDTGRPGVYTLDVAFKNIEEGILYCELYSGYSYKKNYMLANMLNNTEMVIRSIMQYFSYFFRFEHKQKPDVVEAAIHMKASADKLTIEELQRIVGPNNSIDFSMLGEQKIMDTDEIEVDKLAAIDEEEESN